MLSALLWIQAIKGEAKDAKYADWIELDGWNFGQSQSGSSAFGAGSGSGKVSMDDFQFTKHFDKSSVKLFEACATGQFIDKATLVVRRSGQKSGQLEDHLKIEFTGLIISGYSTRGSAGDAGLPSESIAFNFTKHLNTYFHVKDGSPSGQIVAGYDVKTGVAV
jgi:type VI secretion system secreted protein Hcp